TRNGSTSTGAPSPWGTPWGVAAPGSRSRCCTSCGGVVPGTASPRCASVEGWVRLGDSSAGSARRAFSCNAEGGGEQMARLAALVIVVALVTMGNFGLGSPGARAQAPQVLKVGVPGPMQLPVGQGIIYGLTLAAGEINAAGGIMGRKITIVPEDEAEKPEVGVAAMRKMVQSDKMDVMIGGQTRGGRPAPHPHISRAKRPQACAGAS